MQRLVRLAIGTVQSEAELSFASSALMAAFEQAGLRVQSFLARACFTPNDAAASLTGQASRHLDTWLMEPEACRVLFDRGARNSDFALVQGRFDLRPQPVAAGGSLSTLCEWLDLPSIAVLDARWLRDCQLPHKPPGLDAVIVDGVSCCRDQCKLQTWLEALWGVPVLGFMKESPRLRSEVTSLANGTSLSPELSCALAEEVISPLLLARILSVALSKQGPPQHVSVPMTALLPQPGMRVATAFDEAFHCYFPDALDQLEILGAEIVDFSPLRDDRLPLDTDLVYFGCGRPDLFAAQLAENCCMSAALRRHVEGGGRLYAECGGLAYLAEHIEMPDGSRLPMTGALPLSARLQAPVQNPVASEVSLLSDCWLGEAGSALRGYRNNRWSFSSLEPTLKSLADADSTDLTLMAYQNAIGSNMHLNFAMLPPALDRLFEPLAAGHLA